MYKLIPNIGITQSGEISLDSSWIDRLLPINIISTKSINHKMQDCLLNNMDKIILHINCTGYGESIFEPYVPSLSTTYYWIIELIEDGFDPNNIVLNINPIIPTDSGLDITIKVLDTFIETNIPRVRYSFLKMNPIITQRFIDRKINIPYESNPSQFMIDNALQLFEFYSDIYTFETHTENTKHSLSIVSKKDFKCLDKKVPNIFKGTLKESPCKLTELLLQTEPCDYDCVYCPLKSKFE